MIKNKLLERRWREMSVMDLYLLLQAATDIKRFAERSKNSQMLKCATFIIKDLESSIAKEKLSYRSTAGG